MESGKIVSSLIGEAGPMVVRFPIPLLLKLIVMMMMLMVVMMTTTRYGSGGTNGPSLAFGGGQVKFGDIL